VGGGCSFGQRDAAFSGAVQRRNCERRRHALGPQLARPFWQPLLHQLGMSVAGPTNLLFFFKNTQTDLFCFTRLLDSCMDRSVWPGGQEASRHCNLCLSVRTFRASWMGTGPCEDKSAKFQENKETSPQFGAYKETIKVDALELANGVP